MISLSSKDKTILVFSDPHQEIDKVEKIIKAEAPDITACLGDWYDSHHRDSEEDVRKTCEFLAKNANNENFYTLIGNHDVSYIWAIFDRYTQCSGYSRSKAMMIKTFFEKQNIDIKKKFLWYFWIDNVLCTHAGLNAKHLPARGTTVKKESLSKFLDKEVEDAESILSSGGGSHWIYRAGYARGGSQPVGGLTWQDFMDEHRPIHKLKQLFGHTHSHDNTIKTFNRFDDTCIDTGLNEYLLIRNGEYIIKKFADL